MTNQDITNASRGMMQVYAARDYFGARQRSTDFVEVNFPEYVPTVPQNDKTSKIVLIPNYFVNDNFPSCQGTITANNFLTLPLAGGTTCPTEFPKGTKFLLLYPTGKLEEGFLIFLTKG